MKQLILQASCFFKCNEMKYFKFLFFSSILIILCVSCFKDKLVGEYYLTEEMKDQVPFKGYETLHFINDSNNIIKIKAEDRIDVINKYYTDHTDKDYVLCEYNHILFSNESYGMDIHMEACLFKPTGIGFEFIYLNGKYDFHSGFSIFVDDSTVHVLDSLLINGSWLPEIYYDTMKYDQTQPFPHDLPNIPIKSYYSKSLGIVKVDFSDGSIWELKEIDW